MSCPACVWTELRSVVTVGHLVLLHQSTLPPAPNSQVTGAGGGSGAGRISGVISVSGVLVQPVKYWVFCNAFHSAGSAEANES